jgi:hypothetical protein
MPRLDELLQSDRVDAAQHADSAHGRSKLVVIRLICDFTTHCHAHQLFTTVAQLAPGSAVTSWTLDGLLCLVPCMYSVKKQCCWKTSIGYVLKVGDEGSRSKVEIYLLCAYIRSSLTNDESSPITTTCVRPTNMR